MQEQTFQVTFREAVLSSLLAHAAIIILILLFPDAFTPSRSNARLAAFDPNEPIDMRFMTEPPQQQAQEESSLSLGDAGKNLSSDPRPPGAPPPRNDDPYARGNNPNRFASPPAPAPPAPTPGAASQPISGDAGQDQGEDAGTDVQAKAGEGPEGEKDEDRTGEDQERERLADGSGLQLPEGQKARSGEARRPKRSLRDALDNLSGSGGITSGGSDLRFDNPVGGLSGPSGGLSFDTKGFDWGPYARKIYWIIWSNWTRGWPPAARAGLPGVSTVRFRIHRDGTITGIVIMDSSGTEAFDTCATLALEASSPLPPLPPEFTKESEGITARFLYNVSEP